MTVFVDGASMPANVGDTRDAGLIPGLGRSLEKEIETHSSILAWRIIWTEDPGGLESMESQRIEHDWSNHSQSYGFSSGHVWMWELDCEESWMLKNCCFWTVVLENTLESPLDCKEIQPVHSKGNQSWVFFGRNDAKAETPVLWPPHAKSWIIGKDSDAGRDWGQEEKGTTEDEMAGWHHWLNGLSELWELVMDREAWVLQLWAHKESGTTEWLNWTELKQLSTHAHGAS